MTSAVETTSPDASARAVARRLAETGVGSLVVVGDGGDQDETDTSRPLPASDGAPLGIVTESDLVRLLADGADLEESSVASFMSPNPTTVSPETSLERAAELLEQGDFRRLPVVRSENGEPDRLVGIVTTTDLSYYLPHLTLRRRRAEEARLDGERLPSGSPEMAYEEPDWEFEHSGEPGVNVGDEVRFRKQLSDGDVRSFAAASGDTNRLHLDDEFAAETRFGRRIAHGVLTTGLISAALARLPGLTIYLAQDLRFLGPVEIDEVATAACRVIEDLGGSRYRVQTIVFDEDGERVVDGESTVLIDDLPEGIDRPAVSLT